MGAAAEASPPRSFVTILEDIHDDHGLRTAPQWTDNNLIRDGVLARARSSMVKHASQWRVPAEDIELKAAELMNAAGMIDLLCRALCFADGSSILHRGGSKPTEAGQSRLLLHA